MSRYDSPYDHRGCEHEGGGIELAACDMDTLLDDVASAPDSRSFNLAIEQLRAAWERLKQPWKPATNEGGK